MHQALTSIVSTMTEMQKFINILNKKVDAANRLSATYEAYFKTIVGNTNILRDIGRNLRQKRQQEPPTPAAKATSEAVTDVPNNFELGDEELRQIVRDFRNTGNFAVNLYRRLWPEL